MREKKTKNAKIAQDMISLPVQFLYNYFVYCKEKRFSEKIGAKSFLQEGLKNESNRRKGDTLFILGGGQSINDLTPDNWSVVKKNTSIGLNAWFVHNFEPTYLLTEGFRLNEVGSPRYNWMEAQLKKYAAEVDVKILIKNCRPKNFAWPDLIDIAPQKIFSAATFSVPGRSNEHQSIAMRFLEHFRISRHHLLSSRVSVTCAMSLGLHLGFKEIVLCGIDLNDGRYFWEEESFQVHPLVSPPRRSGQPEKGVHSTMNPKVNKVTADQSIRSMAKYILYPSGVKIYTSSEKSRLFPSLPKYEFPC